MITALSLLLFCAAIDSAPVLNEQDMVLTLVSGDQRLNVSLRCPDVVLDAGAFGGDAPAKVVAERDGRWSCAYEPAALASGAISERTLHAEWSAEEQVLRKWITFRITNTDNRVTLREVTLEKFASPAFAQEFRPLPPQSYPLFLKGFFAGIEFPVASTRVEGGVAFVGHRPMCDIRPGVEYQSRKAVYGPANSGAPPAESEVLAFHRYIERHRPAPKGMHFNYNSWWTSPVRFSETDILGLMKEFEDNLYKKHGVALDSFTIDMGWSDPKGVWDIDAKLFPEGFSKISKAAEAMGGRLGLWCSPSSGYPPAVDPQWALDHGYESFKIPNSDARQLSLAGEKYRAKYASSISAMIKQFDIHQVKLDGLYIGGADYMAGNWPSEATAAGGAEAFDAMRAAGNNVWLEATYSPCASPWWLFHVNSVIGGFGDDSPFGRVPAPLYRESYTSARDFFNLQSADRLPSPIPAQEILGIIHQSDDSFMNDAVTCVLRGHAFISLYVNPKFMNDQRWAMLAGLMKWSRTNEDRLTAPNTLPLRPATWLRNGIPWSSQKAMMPREPYGYAHWSDDGGLVMLRNPWAEKQAYALDIPASMQGALHAVSLFPEPRVYTDAVVPGEKLNVALAPYETIVLSFAKGEAAQGLPRAENVVGTALSDAVSAPACEMRRVVYKTPKHILGPDYTSLAPLSGKAMEIDADFEYKPISARVRLLALFEGRSVPEADGTLSIDGKEVALRSIRSDTGFSASGAPIIESWRFLECELPQQGGRVSLRATAPDDKTTVSLWLLADKSGEVIPPIENGLPSPERISLDSVCLLKPASLDKASQEVRKPAQIRRIKGIFLDALEPVSAKQGWGKLMRNTSVRNKEMVIGGKHFKRGLGTHADSELIYNLEGKYRRFQASAGPDSASCGSMCFSVLADGKRVWESGRMIRGDAPKPVDINTVGVKELRLLVDDGGDGIGADHADWADACLLY
jgi:hypothetical protein